MDLMPQARLSSGVSLPGTFYMSCISFFKKVSRFFAFACVPLCVCVPVRFALEGLALFRVQGFVVGAMFYMA